MNSRTWSALALVACGVLIGAFREFLFINLNYQIDHVARHTPFSYAHSMFQTWTQGMSLNALIVFKWALALTFIGITWGLCLFMLNVLFGGFRYWATVSWMILGIGLAALVFHALARWVPGLEDVSVRLLHAVQYPVLLIIIWAASGLAPRRSAEAD
jgi:hypothetical protein